MLDRQNHAAGGANGSIMVGMFVCLCLTSKKPSEREFFKSILAQKIELWRCETAVLKLALKRHEKDPLLSSSKQQAA
jgi:hypothetical protein